MKSSGNQTATLFFINLAVHNANTDIHCTGKKGYVCRPGLCTDMDLIQSTVLMATLILLAYSRGK